MAQQDNPHHTTISTFFRQWQATDARTGPGIKSTAGKDGLDEVSFAYTGADGRMNTLVMVAAPDGSRLIQAKVETS